MPRPDRGITFEAAMARTVANLHRAITEHQSAMVAALEGLSEITRERGRLQEQVTGLAGSVRRLATVMQEQMEEMAAVREEIAARRRQLEQQRRDVGPNFRTHFPPPARHTP